MSLDFWPEIDSTVVSMLLKIAVVIVVVVLVNRSFSWGMRRLQKRRGADRRLYRQFRVFFTYVVYVVGLGLILIIIDVDVTVIATSLGIVGIAVGFGARDILANLLSGIFLLFERTYQVSDVVKIGEVYGIVRLIKVRSTEIRTFDRNIVSIPNSMIASTNVVNMTSGSDRMITSITVKLAYGEDYERVKTLMKDVASTVDGVFIDAAHDVKFEITNIGERYHGLNLIMYFYLEAIKEPWIRSEVHEKINKELVTAGVEFHRDSPK
jgi:small-conductance mechanosensitive channel